MAHENNKLIWIMVNLITKYLFLRFLFWIQNAYSWQPEEQARLNTHKNMNMLTGSNKKVRLLINVEYK